MSWIMLRASGVMLRDLMVMLRALILMLSALAHFPFAFALMQRDLVNFPHFALIFKASLSQNHHARRRIFLEIEDSTRRKPGTKAQPCYPHKGVSSCQEGLSKTSAPLRLRVSLLFTRRAAENAEEKAWVYTGQYRQKIEG
jgi:hypothetical protein